MAGTHPTSSGNMTPGKVNNTQSTRPDPNASPGHPQRSSTLERDRLQAGGTPRSGGGRDIDGTNRISPSALPPQPSHALPPPPTNRLGPGMQQSQQHMSNQPQRGVGGAHPSDQLDYTDRSQMMDPRSYPSDDRGYPADPQRGGYHDQKEWYNEDCDRWRGNEVGAGPVPYLDQGYAEDAMYPEDQRGYHNPNSRLPQSMGTDSSAYYGNTQQAYGYDQDNGRGGMYHDQGDYYDDTVVGGGTRGVNSDYPAQGGYPPGGSGGGYPPTGSAAQLSAADADFQDMRQRYDEDY